MKNTIAFITSDPKVSVALLDWLSKQEPSDPLLNKLIVGYDERSQALDYLAGAVYVNTECGEPFIDDPDFFDGLAEEVEELALEMAKENKE